MSVIITGHRGFIGGKLHTKLIENKESFIAYDVIDRKPFPVILKEMEVDTIYHIGAMAGIGRCEQDRLLALYLNVIHVQKWAEIALEKDARIVFTSSAAAAKVIPTWYGHTKRMAESILLHYQRVNNLKVTIFRLPNIYGPGSLQKSSVIASMCRDAIFNKGVYIHGTGNQTRTFMHINDVVNLLLNFKREGFYRVANGRLSTINHLGKEIAEAFKVKTYKIPARSDSLLPAGTFDSIPKDLSADIKVHFSEGLQETIQYFKENCKEGGGAISKMS